MCLALTARMRDLRLLLALALTGCVGGDIFGGGGVNDGGLHPRPLHGDASTVPATITACGDTDPGCMTLGVGPGATPPSMFPLQSDPQPSAGESDNGVDRDANGYLYLATSKASFDFLWIANYADWNIGTVSKLDSKQVKETARYFTVTCFSNPTGGRAACDGKNGCCTRDDNADYQFRKSNNGMSSGTHQAVQQHDNHPSRTAVDFNGDMWVANRAFGGQSSVSKIANDPWDCVERNGAPGLQTSHDTNGDGVIDTDCNQNGTPDDLADVKSRPCTNGMEQEFYGFDDECVLFTTNTNSSGMIGRPLALASNSKKVGPADAWAGTYNDGKFFKIDGVTGMTVAEAQLTGKSPYGAAIDAQGILWAPEVVGSNLYYFDTNNPSNSGQARASTVAHDSYGITLDRDQNLWMGGYPSGNASRYTPDRSGGFATLGKGYWTVIKNPGGSHGTMDVGRGIAADSRSQNSYFVWMGRHPNWVIQIPASTIPPPNGADVSIDGTGFNAIAVAGSAPAGVGVDVDQNLWAIASGDSVATRLKVDAAGTVSPPDITSGTKYNGCPVGDRCYLKFKNNPDPTPYTYSDFTGFGLRNFTNPKGVYSWIQKGCGQAETHWVKVNFDADVPASTTLTVRARVGATAVPDASWSAWSPDVTMSPEDLTKLMPDPSPYMQVEFDMSSMDRQTTPRLKGFTIVYKCGQKIG